MMGGSLFCFFFFFNFNLLFGLPTTQSFLFVSNRVLLVDRRESRPGEWMARKFFGALSSVCSTSMSVPIQTVATAMVSNTLRQPEEKTEILENKDISSLGKSAEKWKEREHALRWLKPCAQSHTSLTSSDQIRWSARRADRLLINIVEFQLSGSLGPSTPAFVALFSNIIPTQNAALSGKTLQTSVCHYFVTSEVFVAFVSTENVAFQFFPGFFSRWMKTRHCSRLIILSRSGILTALTSYIIYSWLLQIAEF